MPNPIHLVPAYGRDYKTEAAALSAWRSGLDFLIYDISSPYDGRYCSCRDFARNETVLIRFHKLSQFVITNGLKFESSLRSASKPNTDDTVAKLAEANRRNYSADRRAIKLGKLDEDDTNAES